MNDFYITELDFAKSVANKAGKIMRQYFDGDQQKQIKEDGSTVTVADTLINSMVIEELAVAFPHDGLIGEEESTTEYGMGRKWFCDPIDGTKAYTWGTPTSMFSLALVVDGKPVVGVVYDPFLGRMYYAVRGSQSYCDDSPLRVNDKQLKEGVVAVTSSVERMSEGIPYLHTLAAMGVSMATFSGAIYKAVLVAKGRMVAYVESIVNAHDMAAVQLVVEGAGGKVTGMDGKPLDYSRPFKGAIVTNGTVHGEITKIVIAPDAHR